MDVHLVDGTYELFRQFYGRPPRPASDGSEIGATHGVVATVAMMLAGGATHIGVATDRVVESFRNALWPGYKTGEGVDEVLKRQFPLLDEALSALGVFVWSMVDLEADDALASGAAVASADPRVAQVLICTPDKDLAQCVEGERVVQLDRRHDVITDEQGVLAKFGVWPKSIPDWLALVGDTADGFPGIRGWGKRSASIVLLHYDHIDQIPSDATDWDPAVLGALRGATSLADRLDAARDAAMLFRTLATLRIDEALLSSVDDLQWQGPRSEFADICRVFRDPALYDRVTALARR